MGVELRKLALAGLAFVASLASAFAADLPSRAMAPPPPAPMCTWCGFYVGVDGGFDWARQTGATNGFPSGFGAPAILGGGIAGIGVLPTSHSLNGNGGLAGVHAGYNWQLSNWLLGVEGDWTWLNRSVSNSQTTLDTFGGPRPDGNMNISSSNHWLASLRGRLGLIAQPQWLLYVTGGGALTSTSTTATFTPIPGAIFPAPSANSVSFDRTRAGFVVGAGVEWMFAPNWILRTEYLHYQFAGASGTLPYIVPAGSNCTGVCGWNASTSQLGVDAVRAGVSYKF